MRARILLPLSLGLAFIGVLVVSEYRNQAVEQATSIEAKDRASVDVAKDIEGLKEYSSQHMGTSVRIYLGGSYDRAVAATKATSDPATSARIYAEAQASCASLKDSVSQSKCISDYLAKNAAPAPNPKPVQMPEQSKFIVVTSSPTWSPDLAGAFLLGAAVAGALGLIKLLFSPKRRRR